jgi:hypothetical protein
MKPLTLGLTPSEIVSAMLPKRVLQPRVTLLLHSSRLSSVPTKQSFATSEMADVLFDKAKTNGLFRAGLRHGEYAATTFFVTDDPSPKLRLTRHVGRYTDIAVFSDGIERLVLDFASKKAFGPFFDRMFNPLAGCQPGRNRALSRSLHDYLSSKSVTNLTDDDKTLILAKRVQRSV